MKPSVQQLYGNKNADRKFIRLCGLGYIPRSMVFLNTVIFVLLYQEPGRKNPREEVYILTYNFGGFHP
jgi:hypothetical protein